MLQLCVTTYVLTVNFNLRYCFLVREKLFKFFSCNLCADTVVTVGNLSNPTEYYGISTILAAFLPVYLYPHVSKDLRWGCCATGR